MGNLLAAEQALDFALRRRISLLYLRTADCRRLRIVRFRGTGGTADTVTPCPAAKQDNHITRVGSQPLHRASRRSAHNRPNFHALRHIVRVINLLDISGRKPNLISVGAVAVSGLAHQLLLRKLSRNRVFYRYGRIRRPGHAHCLVNIGTARERVTNRAAKAGCRASERLDFRRMVMRLVFKIDKPFLCLAVHLNRNHDGARIYLVGFFLVV